MKLLSCVFLLLTVSVASAQSYTVQLNTRSAKSLAFFRCAVTLDIPILELESYGWATPTLKHVEVFLDKKAFSEENLKSLFGFLSKKYSDSKTLVAVVHTDWNQLNFPSDCPPIGLTNQPARPDEYDYHQATYYRNEEIEYFRYNPMLKTPDFKMVVLKGKISNPPSQNQ